jgi:hypothetical protein
MKNTKIKNTKMENTQPGPQENEMTLERRERIEWLSKFLSAYCLGPGLCKYRYAGNGRFDIHLHKKANGASIASIGVGEDGMLTDYPENDGADVSGLQWTLNYSALAAWPFGDTENNETWEA